MNPNYDGPGVYRHYKGGLYEVLGLGVKEATLGSLEEEFDVVYRPLDARLNRHDAAFILRPLAVFGECVAVGVQAGVLRLHQGEGTWTMPRFEKVGPLADRSAL